MKIEDLSVYDYMVRNESVKAVGWLEGEFEKGKIDSKVIELLEKYPIKNRCRGWHSCEYCVNEEHASGNGEYWTVGKKGVYAAPSLIIHYIKEHNYLPPEEFIDSILNGIKPDNELYDKIINETETNRISSVNKLSHKEIMNKFINDNAKEIAKDIDAKIISDILNDKTW